MPVDTTLEITGLREALNTLGKLDSKSRFKATNKIKASGSAMVDHVKKDYPGEIGVSMIKGMAPSKSGKGRLSYEKSKVDKGIQVVVGGRARTGVTPLVTLVQKNAGASMFSMAGSAGDSGQFSKLLTNVFGPPQRGLWRSRKFIYEQGTADIMAAIDEVVADANEALRA